MHRVSLLSLCLATAGCEPGDRPRPAEQVKPAPAIPNNPPQVMTVFPEFHWDKYFWKTAADLPSWRDFKSRNAAAGNRLIEITFAPEGRDDAPLNPSEIEMVRWVINHSQEICESMLLAFYKEYPDIRLEYDFDTDDDEGEEEPADENNPMPELSSPGDLKRLLESPGINVHPLSVNGMPYFGITFRCKWDEEHGAGVLMHGTRVVEIGGADTAILLWMAEEDAEQVAKK